MGDSKHGGNKGRIAAARAKRKLSNRPEEMRMKSGVSPTFGHLKPGTRTRNGIVQRDGSLTPGVKMWV